MSRKATPPIVDSLSADDFLQKLDENAAASGRDVPAELFAEADALLAPFQ